MTSDPLAVAMALNDTTNSGNSDSILAFFSDDAVLRVQPPASPTDPGIYNGKEAIRGWFEPQLQRHLHVEPHMS